MLQLLKATWKAWREDEATVLAAALAYFTAVSIAPLLVLIVVIAGFFLGRQAAQDQLLAQLRTVVGAQGSQFLATILQNASQPTLASAAGLLSLFLLLWGSTNVFSQLQNSLNKIWHVKRESGGSVRTTVRSRLLAFAMVLGAAFLLLASMVLSTVLTALVRWSSTLLPGADWVWQLVNILVTLVLSTLLFGAIFKVLPNARLAWRDVLLGAAVTAVLFVVGNYLLGFYLANAGNAYGAVGSLAVFLLWVFYSAQIFFFGAEFAQAYSQRYGSGIQPRTGTAQSARQLQSTNDS
jgi:membrane protein